MRKIYALLKQYLLALTLLIATTIIIYSCKKDGEISISEKKKELISEAKTYFENEVLKKSLKDNKDPNFRHSIIKRPIWEMAITKKTSLGDAVIVPIKFNGDVFTKPEKTNMVNDLNRTSYLMLYQDKKEQMHAEWVTLIPNKTRKTKSELFSGIVAIEDWGGKFNRAYAFNGTKEYLPVHISQAVTFSKINYKRSFCFEIQHWGYITVGGGTSAQYLGSETFCFSGDSSGGDSDPYGILSDGRHMDEEPNPDVYPLYYFDCNKDLDGSAVIDDNCGCIGGNTGIQSCKEVDVDPNARECLKNIRVALKALGVKNTSKSTGLISKVLNSLNLSTGDDFNAIIIEGAPANNANAQTIWADNNSDWGPEGRVNQIMLSSAYLDRATDLKIAATLMHEYIHAYFDWNLYLMNNGLSGYDDNFKKTYTFLFDKSGEPLNDGFGFEQHKEIAKSFTSQISAMLKNYAIENGIPIPADPEYFNKMAWGGLQDTPAFKFAPEGATYTIAAESGTASATITQTLKCKTL